MYNKIEQLIRKYFGKYTELVIYGFFGAVTTAVNFIVYILVKFLMTTVFGLSEGDGESGLVVNTAQVAAFIAAVLVAFYTNKRYVFKENEKNKNKTIVQFAKFTSMRLASFFFELVSFNIMVFRFHINDLLSKIILAVVIVILNYIISKIFIFTKKNKSKENVQSN